MRTAYKCRAYPTPEQSAMLSRTFGCVRVVWNQTLAWRRARWHDDHVSTTFTQANAFLTELKGTEEFRFLKEVSAVPLQQVLRTQQRAFANFFARRARHPRFKSRTGRQSAEFTRSGFRYRGGTLTLAKTHEPLPFVWSWPTVDPATISPTTVTVSRDPCGRWYVSFVVETADLAPLPVTGTAIGVDLGISVFATTSGGERVHNPHHLERKARNLARYQRRMARCRPGSANRRKAALKVARAHRKVRAARVDFLHRTSTHLLRSHDLVVLEDLSVRNMVRNRRLARSISDCGWRTFRQLLEYKASRWGRAVVVVDRWLPSTKTCSTCGHLGPKLDLRVRHWTCSTCRARHDRDINAAKNILAAGLAASACGSDVRHLGIQVRSLSKQETQPARAGTSRT
ncbi:RNA-guided endonuclease InsQ/TnpB family protein [Actinophytocola sp. NPDC049390]|uniref:RNA-guided endonuclease InsQ/TnpB family protein n=1 Tax=Actinophytocola sp. NPDC049390 TaxID=3363894 RepID=UPI0037A8E6B0